MYRALALSVDEAGLSPDDEAKLSAHLEGVEVRLQGDRVLLNGRDVTAAIRTARISGLTSRLTRHAIRSEEHTSELQSRLHLVCRLLLEKKNKQTLPRHFHSPLRC